MPQHLSIKANKIEIATMMTSNVSDTKYDVFWQQSGGERIKLPGVDTGIQRQPQVQSEQEEDFINDFIHARRALGAACATSDIFQKYLKFDGGLEENTDEIQVELRTNEFFRGNVFIKIDDNNSATITVEIGSEPVQFQNSHPKVVEKLIKHIQLPIENKTSLMLALNVLKSEGAWMLSALEKRA
jgi:hypothetical protein